MGTNENQSGVSRRDLLKKGAVAGGIVWVAPIVLSDAAGATNFASPPVCDSFYIVKYNGNDGSSLDCGTGGACVTGTYESACDVGTTTSTSTATTVTITFTYTGTGTVQQVTGYQKGPANIPCESVEATKTGNTYTLTYNRLMSTGQETSNYQVILCVKDA